MNNPYLLKKQLEENEEQLTSFMRDMNIWQEQMKRKEQPRIVEKHNEKKKLKTNHPSKPVTKKISSWDYNAWDKFDVDEACQNLDLQDKSKENDNDKSSYTVPTEQVSEAIHLKNLGNELVKKQKWAEAILKYTQAIELFDNDPIFYANRALCYLKTKDYKLAVIDCNASLKLDVFYVKSYQRRSAAYIALGMFNEAKVDLNEVLRLEPNNKQAKHDMEIVIKKTKQNAVKKNSDHDTLKKNTVIDSSQNNISNMLCKNVEEPIKNIVPEWPSRVGWKQIISKQKPPHLRSKKPYCMPKIKNVQIDKEKLDNIHLLETTLKEVCCETKKENQPVKKEISKKDSVQKEIKHCLIVPPPPQTYVTLKKDWEYLQNDSKKLFHYLKQIPGKHLPSIVRYSMDNDLFADILRILKTEFIPSGHEVTNYMIGLSELPRLQMLVMFCSNTEVSYLKELLNHVSKSVPKNVLQSLQKSFSV